MNKETSSIYQFLILLKVVRIFILSIKVRPDFSLTILTKIISVIAQGKIRNICVGSVLV